MPGTAISIIQAQLDQRLASGLSVPMGGATGPQWKPVAHAQIGPSDFDSLVNAAAAKHEIEPELIKAVMRNESNFNPNAVSRAGAKGLMQIMDFNSRAMGVTNPFDPAQSIDAGARILKGHLTRYGDVTKALAAYNAGGPTVDRYGGMPPYRETQTYVARVMDTLRAYRQQADRGEA